MESLRETLTAGQAAALTQAITGLGGVGKTQLALEYAYCYAPAYRAVWWIRSEEPGTLAADYAGLAGELDLPERDETDQTVIVAAVRRWLEQHSDWLLVFDNAGEPDFLRDYCPQGANGHILITSRNPAWRGVVKPLSVQVFDRPESVAFLLKRTGQTDEDGAKRLAEVLGDLPLALEQAGAYMDATGRSLGDYLDLYRARQLEVLNRYPPSTDYPATVATTWDLSFQNIREASPTCVDLLNLCAFLAPDDIPQSLLREGAEHLPKSLADTVTDDMAFDDALAALRRYSIVEVTDDALSLHRLVQAVVRDRLTETDRQTWVEAAVRLVNAAFPYDSDDVRTWDECARLLAHGLVASEHAEALEVAPEATARLLNQTGLYLRGRAQFAEAKAHLERALTIAEAAYGPNHPNVATCVNNLGGVLRDLGDLEGAKGHFERALTIDEAAYGPNHPNVASIVNNLGGMLRDLGDLEGAKGHFERALTIAEAAYGPNHPNVATCVNNLGGVLRDLGDLEGAKGHFERALTIDEAAYGPNHPNVASIVNNLGGMLRDLGDLEGAKGHYERALTIFRDFLGEDHPTSVKVRRNLESLDAERP